jgi:hypothetical protein
MLLDNLAVFVVTLISSLFLCTTSVHGLPKSSSTLHYIRSYPSADLSSSLRLLRHHPVPSVDYDLGGDISEMLIGESNELPTIDDHDDDLSSLSSSFASSLDASNEPFHFYLHPSPSESFSRKLLLSLEKRHQQKEEEEEQQQQQQQKRSNPPSNIASPSLPTQLNINSAFADPSQANSVVNFSQLSESTRLSPSLKILVETNPFARAWLTMLLQKVMEEQPVPYIFKYGRRRKK